MLERNMWKIYRKCFILMVLGGCVYVFGYADDFTRTVTAAPCVQECETTEGSCNSECQSACEQDSTQTACDSCIISCHSEFRNCMRHAIWCENEVSQPGRCTVNWGLNCPYDPVSGTYTCDPNQGASNGYSLTCTTLGGGTCVACPDYRYCTGTGGQSPCVGY